MPKVVGYDESAKKRVTCRGCGAINEYFSNEVQSYHGTDYGGGPDGQEWVVCAGCGGRAIIKSW